jgi:serine/threonine-protein kinase
MPLSESNPQLGHPDWLPCERVLRKFERAWQEGSRPDLDNFLPSEGEPPLALLSELVQTDIEFRRKAGEPARLEDYLERYPLLVAEPNTEENGASRRDRYELLDVLGEGTFGTVYRAKDRRLDRLVALKVPRPGRSDLPREAERFLREARSTARLRHPHIVPIHDVCLEGPDCFLVSEYVPGTTLSEVLRTGRLPHTRAAEILAQVARAVAHAHRQGVIHRDLKPSNILIDADGQPRVLDFGLARPIARGGTLTEDGTILGTPAYMAPEQARSDSNAVSARSDIYALGVILYELLTGELPFRGTPSAILYQLQDQEPIAPRRLDRRVPTDLETIALKCLEKDPHRRYAGADALADDLERWLAGQPIRARAVGPGGRIWRACCRRPQVAGLSAALVLAFLGGLAGITWQWHRAEANLRAADRSFRQARQAVDTLYTRTYVEGLFSKPGLEPLRPEILREILRYYRDFLAERRDDPALRAELAEACYRAGNITGELGDKAGGLEALRQALPLYEILARETPPRAGSRAGLARCVHTIAILEASTGQKERAIASYTRARELFGALAQESPGQPWIRATQSAVYGNLANLLMMSGDHTGARRAYEDALAIQERLAREDPFDPGYQTNLALTYCNAAGLFGPSEKTLALYQRALEIRTQLVRANPENAFYRRNLARSHQAIGMHLAGWKGWAEARQHLETTCDLMERTVQTDSGSTTFRGDLGQAYLNLAVALDALGDRAGALRRLEQSVPIFEQLTRDDPGNPGWPGSLALVFGNLGAVHGSLSHLPEALDHFQRALALHERTARGQPASHQGRRSLADLHANLGQVLAHLGRRDQAIAAYQESVRIRAALARELPDQPAERAALEHARLALARADSSGQLPVHPFAH